MKAFYLWQALILALIGVFLWQSWYGSAIGLGIIEALILYAHLRNKEENQYVLPASVARTMKAAPEQVAYEATILSTSLLIIGGIAFAGYYTFYVPATWVIKGFIIFNSLCLALFMFAQLHTAFKQYVTLMETQKMIKEMSSDKIEVLRFDKVKGGYKKENGKNKR